MASDKASKITLDIPASFDGSQNSTQSPLLCLVDLQQAHTVAHIHPQGKAIPVQAVKDLVTSCTPLDSTEHTIYAPSAPLLQGATLDQDATGLSRPGNIFVDILTSIAV